MEIQFFDTSQTYEICLVSGVFAIIQKSQFKLCQSFSVFSDLPKKKGLDGVVNMSPFWDRN